MSWVSLSGYGAPMTPMKPIAAKPDDNFLKNLSIHFTEGSMEGNACVTVGNYQHSSTSFTRDGFMDLNMGIEEDSNWQQSQQQQQQFNHNFASSRSNQFGNDFHDNGHHSATTTTAPKSSGNPEPNLTSAMSFLDSNGKWTDELIHEFNKTKSNGFTSFNSSYNTPWHQVELRPEVPDLNMSQEPVSSGLKFTDQPMTPGRITQDPGTIIKPSVHIQARTCSGEDGTRSFTETQENGIRRPRMQVTPVTPFTFVRQPINFQMDGDSSVGQQQCNPPSVLQTPNGTGSEKTAAPMLNPAYQDDFSVCATARETLDATSTGVHDASVPETDFEKAPGKKPRRKKVRPKVVREDKPKKTSKMRVPGETPADVKPKRAYKRRNPEEQTNGEGKAAVRKKQGPTGTKRRGRPPFNHVMTPEAKDSEDVADEVRTSGNPSRRRSLNFYTPAPQLDGIVDNHQIVTESTQQQPPREETLVGHISFDLNMEANAVHDFTGPSVENGFTLPSNKRKESPSSAMDSEVLTKKSVQCNGMLPQNQHGCRISQLSGAGYPHFDSDNREKLVFADTLTSQEHPVATESSQINDDLSNYDIWLLSEKLRKENHIHALDGNHNQQLIQEIPNNQNSGTRAGRLDNTSFDGYEACYSMKENETTLLKNNTIPADMQSTTTQAKAKEVYTLAGDTGLFRDANHHWSQSNFGLSQAHDSSGALDDAQFKQLWNVTQQSPQLSGIRNFMDEGFSFGNSEGVQTFRLQGFADTCNSEVTNEEPVLQRPPKLNFKQRARNPDLNNMKEQSNLALGQGTQIGIQGQQPANCHEFSNSSIFNDGLTTGDSSQIVSFTGLLEVVVRQQRNLDINNNEDRSMVPYQNEIVPYVGAGQMMPYEVKKRRPRPKVDLDEETQRVWRLLLENINSDGIDGTDAEKQRWWEEERRIFRGRAESFIAKMHMVQGDRRFSRWKGSVVDSVVGVFLTQNVSDHLSSSAFMALAARFPLKEGTASNAFEVEKTMDGRIPQDYNDWISERENVRLSQLSDICSTSTDPQSSETKESFSPDMVQTTESYGSNTSGEKDNLVKTAPSADTCIDQESPDSKKINPDIPEPDGCLMSEDKFSFTYSGISRDTFSSNQAEWQGVAQTQHLLTASEHVNSYMHEFGTPSFTDLLSMAESNSFSDLYLNMNHTFQPEKLPSIPDQLQSLQQTELPILSKSGDQAGMHTTYNQMQANYTAAPLISSLGLPVDSTAFTGKERDCLGRPKDDASFPHYTTVCSKETVRTITSSPTIFQGIASTMTIEMPRDEVSCIATCVSDEGNDTSEEASRCAPPFWETNLTNERNFPVEQANFNASSQALNVLDLDGSRHTRLESNSKGVDENVRAYLEDAKHETLSKSPTKARRAKGQASKETDFNWDSLRKEVQSRGLIKGRTPDRSDSLDWEAVRCADVKEISDTIKERGMNNMLAERIKAFLNRLKEKHENVDLEWLRDVPPDKAKEFLLSIRGLGLKSVECVRLLTLHHLAFPVDTNVGRISVRLGWVPLQPLPESLQIHLLEQYPVLETVQRYLWPRLCKLDQRTLYELHYQLITFGKVFCTKSKPNCNACPMRAECRHFASAFASARLALPGPEEKGIVSTSVPITKENESEKFNIRPVMLLPMGERQINFCEPIIEEPATPEPETEEDSENELSDIEDFEDPDEIPTIKLNLQELTENVRSAMENQMMDLQDPNMSKALVALTSEAASLPTPKLKNVSRLRTEHQVYELPDDHQLVQGLDPREPDDPCTYLLAIWTPGETADSIEPPGPSCDSHSAGNLCDKSTCFSCNNTRESNNQIVRATLLVPCRTAMRGSFPLNGTYFQVNEVFADHESSMNPMAVPRSLIWNLPRRTVFFGTSVTSIFRGLTTEGIQFCFWRGFVCVRGFDRKTRAPRPLMARLHFPASKQVRNKTNTPKDVKK